MYASDGDADQHFRVLKPVCGFLILCATIFVICVQKKRKRGGPDNKRVFFCFPKMCNLIWNLITGLWVSVIVSVLFSARRGACTVESSASYQDYRVHKQENKSDANGLVHNTRCTDTFGNFLCSRADAGLGILYSLHGAQTIFDRSHKGTRSRSNGNEGLNLVQEHGPR